MRSIHTIPPEIKQFCNKLAELPSEQFTISFPSHTNARRVRFSIYDFTKLLLAGTPEQQTVGHAIQDKWAFIIQDKVSGIFTNQISGPEAKQPAILICRPRSVLPDWLKPVQAVLANLPSEPNSTEPEVIIPPQFFDLYSPNRGMLSYNTALLNGSYIPQNTAEQVHLLNLRKHLPATTTDHSSD